MFQLDNWICRMAIKGQLIPIYSLNHPRDHESYNSTSNNIEIRTHIRSLFPSKLQSKVHGLMQSYNSDDVHEYCVARNYVRICAVTVRNVRRSYRQRYRLRPKVQGLHQQYRQECQLRPSDLQRFRPVAARRRHKPIKQRIARGISCCFLYCLNL